jgi:hypothetical protein
MHSQRQIGMGAAGEPEFYDLLAKLRQSNQAIIELENAMRQSKAVAAAVGYDVLEARKRQNDMAEQFTTIYRAVTGTVPTGLQGIVVPAWAAVTLVSLLGAWAVLWTFLQTIREKAAAALATEQNRGAILNAADEKDRQSAAAQARGDFAEARRLANEAMQLRNQAGTPSGVTQDFSQWIQDNWVWVAAAVAGIVALPPLLER